MKNLVTTLLFLSLGFASSFSEELVRVASPKIPFTGLTGTVTELLNARPKAAIPLGSYYLDPEELVAENANAIFTCDEAGNAYLSGEGEVYYERFSDVLSDEISKNVMEKFASGHVLVNASADGDIITISFDVQCTQNSILPLYFDTANSFLKVSAGIECVIDYQIAFDLELDSEIVNGDEMLKGVNITLHECSLEIKAIEGDSRNTAKVMYDNGFHDVLLGDESVSLYMNWRLLGNGEDTGEPQKITYERLENGDYAWSLASLYDMSFSGMSVGDEGDGTAVFELFIDIDDSADSENQLIRVIDTEGPKEFRVRQLRFYAIPAAGI